MIATATPKVRRPCCAAKVDALGRLPIGWCGPDCIGRAEHLGFLADQRLIGDGYYLAPGRFLR